MCLMILTRKRLNRHSLSYGINIRDGIKRLGFLFRYKKLIRIFNSSGIQHSSINFSKIIHSCWSLLCHLHNSLCHSQAMGSRRNIRIRYWNNIDASVKIIFKYLTFYICKIIWIFIWKEIKINTRQYL